MNEFSLHSRPALTLGGDALAADTSPRDTHARVSTMSPTAATGRSGAQLWMGSVPKRLDSDQISRAFTDLGAPAPIAVVLRRSTYRVDGVDDPVGFALVDFASAKDAATALTLCEGASFQVPDASTTNTSGEYTFHLRRAAETLRKKVDDASSDDVNGGGVGLAAQLAPLEPETIRARLASMNIAVSPEDEKRWKGEFILIRVYGQLD